MKVVRLFSVFRVRTAFIYSIGIAAAVLPAVCQAQTAPVKPTAISNAASYVTGAVSPGEMIVIWGTSIGPPNLTYGSPTAGGALLGTSAGNTRVLFDGVAAPVVYALATQTSVIVPYEVAGRPTTSVVVEYQGVQSTPLVYSVQAAVPGIFTPNLQGSGQGAILENNSSRLVDSSFPAVAGSTYVQIYCTGLGAVTNQPTSGSAAPSNPLSRTTTTPTVTIGGVSAVVAFSGLTPGSVGLYQVNVQVPAGSPTGSAVPVVISMGGVKSSSVTMAVKAPAAPSAAPILANISPSTALAGSSGLTLTLTGSNFVPGATAYFNGTPLSTTFVTTQQLTAVLPASSLNVAGTFAVTVTNPDTAGAPSLPQSFVVQSVTPPNPQPTISNLSPNSAVAGTNSLPITITGNGFLTSSTVTFNGIAHSASFVSGQLIITLTAADLSKAGNYSVVVTNPSPGGGSSQPATFTVQVAPVAPTLQSLTLSAATVVGGGSVTGTISLSGAAPTGGVQVQVSSSSNSTAQVPTFVTVSGGQSSATFTITTTLVTSSQNVTISASLAGVTKTANLAVNAPPVTATVIYAGTDTGVYRSSDGGVTWQQSLAWPEVSFGFVWGIVIDPLNSSNVYASAVNYSIPGSVLYRSTDAGQTWATISAPSAGPLAIDAVSTNVIYLCSQLGGGLYRSTDKGTTWNPTALAQVYGVTADPTLSGVVYASALTANSALLYKSTDFGATWTLLATNLNLPANNFGIATSITIDPHSSNTLYASGEGLCVPGSTASICGLFKSTDGGNNWQNLGVQGQYSNVAIDNATGALYAGGTLAPYFGYVVKSSDGGKTWTPINTGLTTTGVEVFTDPGNSSNLFAVSNSSSGQFTNGLFRSTNGGANWTSTQVVPAGGQVISFGIPAK